VLVRISKCNGDQWFKVVEDWKPEVSVDMASKSPQKLMLVRITGEKIYRDEQVINKDQTSLATTQDLCKDDCL
jgi:hypothetical protein